MYAVGAVVDGFELTPSGEWVRLSPTGGSPYRIGDVVDGHMLDDDLTWVPLRRAPVQPYVAGDLVDGYVLTPDGEWVPLDSRVRGRVAGEPSRRQAPQPAAGTGARGEQSAAQRSARRAAEHQLAAERAAADRRAVSQEASAEQRATQNRAADARAAAGRASERARQVEAARAQQSSASTAVQGAAPPARRTYRVGDVVNGHVLTPDHRWVPVGGAPSRPSTPGQAARQQPRPGTEQPARRSGIPPIVPLLFVGFLVLQAVRACAG
ncbi:hypothetical protein [Cellulomonas xiejunii]|uniref:hypothetical protein n=1 Tax=Cellulomonas xiejunii TaxID=2968083 RepID=UPI001D0E667D|nr:hypothetical protein [Cellulomonas xiejunii]MCC2313254.1 hypothetical protein [Cellulomonas xiejunii]